MTTIATAFHDLTSNDLWEELIWLQDQPTTKANLKSYRAIMLELEIRAERREYLINHFG